MGLYVKLCYFDMDVLFCVFLIVGWFVVVMVVVNLGLCVDMMCVIVNK